MKLQEPFTKTERIATIHSSLESKQEPKVTESTYSNKIK